MGGGGLRASNGKYTYDCKGEGVTKELDKVFADPNKQAFKDAQANNHFDIVKNVAGNWKDLLVAYGQAGVKVKGKEFDVWCAYLEDLGDGPNGSPQNIVDIAQIRLNALNSGTGVSTTTHGGDHNVNKTATQIDSPCPP
jgi:hypothetical protein